MNRPIEHGVTFTVGNAAHHSYWDLGLILRSVPIASAPEPYISIVDVIGRNKPIDFTEAIDGSVHYKSRTLTMEYMCLDEHYNHAIEVQRVLKVLHGKRCRIMMDDDPLWFYEGRVTCGDPSYKGHAWYMTISAQCDPYKYSKYTTIDTVPFGVDAFGDGIKREYSAYNIQAGGATETISIRGTNAAIVPTINIVWRTTSRSGALHMKNKTNGCEYTFTNGGANSTPEFWLSPGNNSIAVNGVRLTDEWTTGGYNIEFRGVTL